MDYMDESCLEEDILVQEAMAEMEESMQDEPQPYGAVESTLY